MDPSPKYEPIVAALHAAGFGTGFRPDDADGMSMCLEHVSVGRACRPGRSIPLYRYEGRFVLFGWSERAAYVALDEERLVACLCDFLKADDIRCMDINERLIRTYGLVRYDAFEAMALAGMDEDSEEGDS